MGNITFWCNLKTVNFALLLSSTVVDFDVIYKFRLFLTKEIVLFDKI